MLTVAIVYHSGFGHTDILARAVAQGVGEAGGTPDLLRIAPEQADFADAFNRIARADAVIFGSPTYMGTVSAPMKAFMDASARPYFAKAWKDKMAAAFTVSGSPSGDKLNTLTTLAIFAAQHGMLWIGTGQAPGNNDDLSAATEAENRLGSFLGALGGGFVFDLFGNYDHAVRFGVALGLVAGVVQITVALMRPPRAPLPA